MFIFVSLLSALRRNEADATADSSATTVLLASIDETIKLAMMKEAGGVTTKPKNDVHSKRIISCIRMSWSEMYQCINA